MISLDHFIFLSSILCFEPLGMIPYPEPYQSVYQQRRLGALGLEWNPNSLKLATGPDFTLDPEFQMLPLADPDILTEPLPEFVDLMDWEPDIEMQSDDTDSDFDVNEDYVTGGEQGSLSSNSSVDSEGRTEDGETDDTKLDRVRRSKRKKQKAEVSCYFEFLYRIKVFFRDIYPFFFFLLKSSFEMINRLVFLFLASSD